MENKIARLKQGRRIAFISSIVSLLLAVMKGIIGYLFGSQVLIADAFHSGADLMTHAASGFGLWIASRSKTTKFPFGLYRAETLACLIVGGFIVMAGIEIFREGYHRLFYLEPVKSFPILPVAASIISSIAAFFVAKMELRVGKSIGSQSLIATSRGVFLDIYISLIVSIGILLAYFRIPYIEGAIIILISLLLFKLGIANTWTSLLVLMDANLDPELQYELEKKINEIYGVKGVSDVKIRQSGPFRMVECTIKTRPSLPLYRAHELANKVEELIARDYENVESVFIHVEPLKNEIVSAIIPVQDIKGVDSLVSGHFGRAPYFVIVRLENGNVEIEDFYTNEFLNEKVHIGIKIVRAIIKYRSDLVFVSNIGEIAYYMLKDKLADVYRVEEGLSVKEIMQRHRLNQLELLAEPTHAVEESQVINQFPG
jgi:cation diffusion facilitator family transporter